MGMGLSSFLTALLNNNFNQDEIRGNLCVRVWFLDLLFSYLIVSENIYHVPEPV